MEHSPLTELETKTMRLLAYGKQYKEIAETDGVSPNTITSRVQRICERLDAESVLQSMYIWARTEPRTKMHLPATRAGKTHKATLMSDHGDFKLFISIGRYDTGQIGEVFLNVGLQGSTLRGVLDSWARMVSIALQWGVPISDIVEKFRDTMFEPQGKTDNPNIPKCSSIIDYAVRWLELEVGEHHG